MIEVLNYIHDVFCYELSLEYRYLEYEFGEMTKSPPSYPYWVGEISDSGAMSEDGKIEVTVFLNGFARGSRLQLEKEKAVIRDYFRHGTQSLVTGRPFSGEPTVLICAEYGGCFDIDTDDDDLKRCQITIKINYWKGS